MRRSDSRGPIARASAVCSRMANAPPAQAHRCILRKRHTPFVQVQASSDLVFVCCLCDSSQLGILQAKRSMQSRSRLQVKTTAVFDYCSTARGNTVSILWPYVVTIQALWKSHFLAPLQVCTSSSCLCNYGKSVNAVHELLPGYQGLAYATGAIKCVSRVQTRDLQSPGLHCISGEPAWLSSCQV